VPIRRRDALVLVLVAAGLVWLGRARGPVLQPPPLAAAPAAERAPAPPFSLPRAGGGRFALEEARGRVVLVHFWATWCAPCRAELPALARLERARAGEGLVVAAVSVDARPEQAMRFAAARGLGSPVLFDPAEEVARRYGVAGYPTTFVVDAEGRVAQRLLGSFAWDAPEVEAWLAELGAGGARARAAGGPAPRAPQ